MKTPSTIQQQLKTKLTFNRVVAMTIGLLIVSAASFGAALIASPPAEPAQAATTAIKPFSLGQPITMGDVGLTITAREPSAGSQPFIAPEGSLYYMYDVSVTNRSDQPIHVLPASDLYLKSADGTVSYLAPFSLADPLRPGDLLPDETIKGSVSFVAKQNIPLTLFIDSAWSGGALPFLAQP